MTTSIDDVFSSFSRLCLKLSFGAFLVALLLTLFFGWQLPQFVPLFFSRPFGVAQLAPFWVVYFYPVISFAFYLMSLLVAKKIPSNLISISLYLGISFVASLFLCLSLIYVLYLVF